MEHKTRDTPDFEGLEILCEVGTVTGELDFSEAVILCREMAATIHRIEGASSSNTPEALHESVSVLVSQCDSLLSVVDWDVVRDEDSLGWPVTKTNLGSHGSLWSTGGYTSDETFQLQVSNSHDGKPLVIAFSYPENEDTGYLVLVRSTDDNWLLDGKSFSGVDTSTYLTNDAAYGPEEMAQRIDNGLERIGEFYGSAIENANKAPEASISMSLPDSLPNTSRIEDVSKSIGEFLGELWDVVEELNEDQKQDLDSADPEKDKADDTPEAEPDTGSPPESQSTYQEGDKVCASCSTELLSDARFCSHCGAPQDQHCPGCGAATKPNAKFCTRCGTGLKSQPSR